MGTRPAPALAPAPALVPVPASVLALVPALVPVPASVLALVPVPWFLNNVACNSLATISDFEIGSLELQRLWAVSKTDLGELHATFWGAREGAGHTTRQSIENAAGRTTCTRPRWQDQKSQSSSSVSTTSPIT